MYHSRSDDRRNRPKRNHGQYSSTYQQNNEAHTQNDPRNMLSYQDERDYRDQRHVSLTAPFAYSTYNNYPINRQPMDLKGYWAQPPEYLHTGQSFGYSNYGPMSNLITSNSPVNSSRSNYFTEPAMFSRDKSTHHWSSERSKRSRSRYCARNVESVELPKDRKPQTKSAVTANIDKDKLDASEVSIKCEHNSWVEEDPSWPRSMVTKPLEASSHIPSDRQNVSVNIQDRLLTLANISSDLSQYDKCTNWRVENANTSLTEDSELKKHTNWRTENRIPYVSECVKPCDGLDSKMKNGKKYDVTSSLSEMQNNEVGISCHSNSVKSHDKNVSSPSNPQGNLETPTIFQKLLQISHTEVKQDQPFDWASSVEKDLEQRRNESNDSNNGYNSDCSIGSDKKLQSQTFTSSNLTKDFKSGSNGHHLKLDTSIRLLSEEFLYRILTQILNFLQDSDMTSSELMFKDVSHDAEINFLINIKSKKKVLNNLSPQCRQIYNRIMHLHSERKIDWRIFMRKFKGIKVPVYTKGFTKNRHRYEKAELSGSTTSINSISAQGLSTSFQKESLEKILDFLKDESQASIAFNNIIDHDQVKFLLSLRRTNGGKSIRDSECRAIHRSIKETVKRSQGVFKWGVTCKNIKERKFLVYHKVPPDMDVNDIKSDISDISQEKRPRVRARRRSRVRNKDEKEPEESRDDKGMISFLPQAEPDEPASTPQSASMPQPAETSEDTAMPTKMPRVNKDKALLMQGLSKPVVASKAERMMMMMGWKGGALGSKGDGIVEPIAPNLLQVRQAGLGHVREDNQSSNQGAKRKQNERGELGRRNHINPAFLPYPVQRLDFEIGVWEPINKKGMTRKQRKQMKAQALVQHDNNLRAMAVRRLLEFVSDDRMLELSFDLSLSNRDRKVVHQLVECLSSGEEPDLDNAEQYAAWEDLRQSFDCVLYTESKGDRKEGTRQLIVYKTVPDDTYLIIPEDFEEIVEPSHFIEDNPENIKALPVENLAIITDTGTVIKEDVLNEKKNIDEAECGTTKKENHGYPMKCGATDVGETCSTSEDEDVMINTLSEPKVHADCDDLIWKLRGMERKPIWECPKDSNCWRYMICRKFLPVKSEESSSDESVEEPKHTRKTEAQKSVDLEDRMRSIKFPSNRKESNQCRIVKLLVSYLEEYYDDKEAKNLRFFGDFRLVDRIVINSFMSQLSECVIEGNLEALDKSFKEDKECLQKLEKMLFEGNKTLKIVRNDEGPFSTYRVTKVNPIVIID